MTHTSTFLLLSLLSASVYLHTLSLSLLNAPVSLGLWSGWNVLLPEGPLGFLLSIQVSDQISGPQRGLFGLS